MKRTGSRHSQRYTKSIGIVERSGEVAVFVRLSVRTAYSLERTKIIALMNEIPGDEVELFFILFLVLFRKDLGT